jgi:hypothetical protein
LYPYAFSDSELPAILLAWRLFFLVFFVLWNTVRKFRPYIICIPRNIGEI